MPLELASPVFDDGGFLPRKYAGNGENISPPLYWRHPPAGVKSFALVLDDPNTQPPRCHWLVFDLHADRNELPEHLPPHDVLHEWTQDGISTRQGRNDLGKVGYSGPAPTKDLPHHYTFTLYALDCRLHVAAGCRKSELLNAIHGHVLEQAQLVARYNE